MMEGLGFFTVPVLALFLFGVTGTLLIFFVRKFKDAVRVVGRSNATVALEYWKHLIQISAGFLVALGILVSGWQLELQAGQFLQRQRHEVKVSRNKQFSEGVERLSKEDFSSTEAALMSLRDLLEEDSGYKRSVKNVLKAEMLGIIARSRPYTAHPASAGPANFSVEVTRRRLRRISEEYVRLFTDTESCTPGAGADFLTVDTSKFDGRSLDLRNGHFVGAALPNSDFTDAKLDCANLLGANFSDSNFNMASLNRANLGRAMLDNVQFVGSDLTFANLTGSNLTGARLYGARMKCANLRGADLTNADIDPATLADAVINEATKLPELVTREQIRDYRMEQRLADPSCQ